MTTNSGSFSQAKRLVSSPPPLVLPNKIREEKMRKTEETMTISNS